MKHGHAVISFNTTHHLRAGRLGGQVKKNNATDTDTDTPPPKITIGIVGGKPAWDALLRDLFHAGAIECVRRLFEQHQQPVQENPNVTYIGSVKGKRD